MKFCIPHCGQLVRVLEDCTVSIRGRYMSSGNENLLIAVGHITEKKNEQGYNALYDTATDLNIHYRNNNVDLEYDITIPAGTVFEITKMYIRNGGWGEDAITFKVKECSDERFTSIKGNLAIPLREVNRMMVDLADEEGEFDE